MNAAAERLRASLGVLDDRLNPVLVLEVRRSLRSRTFLVSFVGAVTVAVVVATLWAMRARVAEGTDGAALVAMSFAVLALCNLGIVPFHAYQSMAGEVDGDTLDPLLLALSPRRVLLGKLGGAFVLALLFASAWLPFVVLATIAGGVDLVLVSVVLVDHLALSACGAALGLCIGAAGSGRLGRAGRLGAMALVVVGMLVSTTGYLRFAFGSSIDLEDELWRLAIFGWMGGLALLGGAARLSHAHENAATPLRAWISLGVVVWVLTTLTFAAGRGFGPVAASHPIEVFGSPLGAMLGLWAAGIFFATEPDGSLRWFRRSVPRDGGAALLWAPWLPGGARALVWLALHLGAVAFAGAEAIPDATWSLLGAAAVAWSCVALFSTLLRIDLHLPWMRMRARVGIVAGTVLVLVLPSLLSFLVFGEPAAGFGALVRPGSGGGALPHASHWPAWVLLAGAVLAAGPRIRRALAETVSVHEARSGPP